MSSPDSKIWLVWWEYADKSKSDFVKAFSDEGEALELYEIMKKHGGERTYYCDQVPYQSEYD